MNDVRRKIERDWVLAPAAEDLAREVESVLKMIDRGATGLDPARLAPLRAALADFRRLQRVGTSGRPDPIGGGDSPQHLIL